MPPIITPPVTLASVGAASRLTAGLWQSDLTRKVPLLWARSPGSASASTNALSTAGDPGGTSRFAFVTPYAMHDFQALFSTAYNAGSGVALAPNPVTFSAVLEYPLSTFFSLTFGGTTTITLGPNALAKSANVAINVPAGGSVGVRTYYQIALPPTNVGATAGTGGSLPAAARFYKLTAVCGGQGESGPSAEVTATPAAGGTVVLSWNADALSVAPTAYRIYAATATGAETLLTTIAAAPNGAPNTWTDTGAIAIPAAWAASTVYAKGALVAANANTYICRVNGTSSTTSPSGTVFSDGAVRWVALGTSAPPAAQQYPLGGSIGITGHPASEAINTIQYSGNGGNYLAVAGTGTWGTGVSAYGFGPFAVIGTPDAGLATPVVAVFGDSITVGYNQYTNGVTSDQGWIALALQTANIPYWLTGKSGELNSTGFLTDNRNRLSYAALATDAIFEYGINDLYTGFLALAVLQANAITAWLRIRSRVYRSLYATTLLPVTSSTDNWATVANQTAGNQESTRSAYNTWLRQGAPLTIVAGVYTAVTLGTSGQVLAGQAGHPLTGIIDPCVPVEVNSAGVLTLNGGLWISNGTAQHYTLDGIHPLNLSVQLIAAAWSPAVLFPAP